MAFHQFNQGYKGVNWTKTAGYDDAKHEPDKYGRIGGVLDAPQALTGYMHYISGGLAAGGNITAMTGTSDDYQTNGTSVASNWVLGGAQATATSCNNYNYRGTSATHFTNGMVQSSIYSRMEHFSHKMCWGQDDCFNQWTFFSAPPSSNSDYANCIGAFEFYATGGYYNNVIRLYTSNQSSTAKATQVGSWDNNYTGTHRARFPWDVTFFNDGLQTTQIASRVGSGGAGTINMRGLGFNLPDYFYISFYCYIYSSYCQSCTADVWDKHYFQESLP